MPMPSRAISSTSSPVRCPAAVLLGLGLAAGASFAQPLELRELGEVRAFGWRLGDVIERRAEVTLPTPWRLEAASLPQPRRGPALELREARWEAAPPLRPWDGRHRLVLRYQLMRSPPEPRLMELPAVELRATGGGGPSRVLRLDAVPLLVSPLAPEPAPTQRGFGALRPDAPPPQMETTALRTRLALAATAAALLGATLASAWFGWPRGRHPRPFDEAWRELRRLPAEPDAAQWRAALSVLHRALDRRAGRTLFVADLDGFLAQFPPLAPLRGELQGFFAWSRRAFFAPGDGVEPHAAALRALCRRARSLERGL